MCLSRCRAWTYRDHGNVCPWAWSSCRNINWLAIAKWLNAYEYNQRIGHSNVGRHARSLLTSKQINWHGITYTSCGFHAAWHLLPNGNIILFGYLTLYVFTECVTHSVQLTPGDTGCARILSEGYVTASYVVWFIVHYSVFEVGSLFSGN